MSLDPIGIIGTEIDQKYLVEEFVAEGGFSLVYAARHRTWNQRVAIKFLKVVAGATEQERETLLRDFHQEGALLRELSSRTACILQAHDVGGFAAADGKWYPFLVLEWLDGETLEAAIERHAARRASPWSIAECIHLLEPAANALAVVHKRGIAHRDLKPANIFVIGEVRSQDAFVKVLDFGIAKVVQGKGVSMASTQLGVAMTSFTPAYGAPEQFSRATYGATGPWTDVFAFALMLVELLTLTPPLEGEDLAQLAFASTNPMRPTPRTKRVAVSDMVEAVFAKALALQPRDRFQAMGEFWSALREAAHDDLAPRIPTAPSSRVTPQALASTVAASGSGLNHSGPHSDAMFPVQSTRIVQPQASLATKRTGVWIGLAALAALGVAGALGATAFKSREKGQGGSNTASTHAASAATMHAEPTAVRAAKDLVNGSCPERMAPIPAGQFFMGYEGDGAQPNEKPVHPVAVSAFCIDRSEVTVAMYKACSDNGKCPRAGTSVEWPNRTDKEKAVYSPLCNEAVKGHELHPINCVTWPMAKAYCSQIDGRLPTSAEWEYAVRGPDGRTYPWGDEAPDHTRLNACGAECKAWGKAHGVDLDTLYSTSDGFASTAPVSSFPKGRSRYGLDDVMGNVMEWTSDWDGEYVHTDEPVKDPTGPASGTEHVLRGGGWNAGYNGWVRPSFRYQYPPEARTHAIGFRCAKTLP